MNHNINIISGMRPEDGWDYSCLLNVNISQLERLKAKNNVTVWEQQGPDLLQVWTYVADEINYHISKGALPYQPPDAEPYEVALDLAQHGLVWDGMFPPEALMMLCRQYD